MGETAEEGRRGLRLPTAHEPILPTLPELLPSHRGARVARGGRSLPGWRRLLQQRSWDGGDALEAFVR